MSDYDDETPGIRYKSVRDVDPQKGRAKFSGMKQSKDEARMSLPLYQRGYELWRAGLSAAEIRNRLHISKTTWEWLLKEGNPPGVPSYEELLIDEVAVIRNSASQIAVELSVHSVKVLRDRMTNAGKANVVIARVLDRMLNGHIDELDTKVLKALLPISNATSVAEAFTRIYGSNAASRALYPTMDHAKAEYLSPLDAVQGGLGDAVSIMPAEQRDQIMSDMSSWTPEQVKAFAETGQEPTPSEVMDR